jgi:hypothetical protein
MLRPSNGLSDSRPSGARAGADGRASERWIGRARALRARSVGAMLHLVARGLAGLVGLMVGSRRRSRRSPGLVGLSDHLLADIGVRRADLHALVYAGAPLARIKPTQGDNVAALDRHRLERTRARPKLALDNDALDPAA